MKVRTISCISRSGQTNTSSNHQHIGRCSYEHTKTNFYWSLGFLAQLSQPTKEGNADGSEHNNEACIKLLEDGSTDGDRLGQLGVLPVKESSSRCDECKTCTLTLGSLALEQRETTEYDEDSSHEIPNVEHHGLYASRRSCSVVTGKECQCETILVECHPEEYHYSHYQTETYNAFLGFSRSEFVSNDNILGVCLTTLILLATDHMTECEHASIVHGNREDQRCTSYGKCIVIRVCLAGTERVLCPVHQLDGSSGSKHSTDIDGHVEQLETRVTLLGILRFIVEVAHHYLEITFEQTCTKTDSQKCTSHSNQSHRVLAKGQRQKHVTCEHDEDTDGNHLVISELVCQNTTNQGQEVNQTKEYGENGTCQFLVKTEIGLKEQSKHCQHRVVTETLACVGQSKRPKTFRLSFEHR